MELKVLSSTAPNQVIRVVSESAKVSLEELFHSKELLTAKVMERSKGNNEYLLSFSGKQVQLFSEAKLFPGENLTLKVQKGSSLVQLEILNRNMNLNEVPSEIGNPWTKTYFSPTKTVMNALEPSQGEISLQKLFQYLDVFFPGIEWNKDVSQFDWKLLDGEANGFYGQKKDSFGFYFHYESTALGSIDSYLHWKKEDFSDLVLHCAFDKLNIYFWASEKQTELKKKLSSNSIFINDIIFHYSSVHRDLRNWVA